MSYIDCSQVQHDVCKLVHYFVNGPHPQVKLWAQGVVIPPRGKLNVDGFNVLWNVREKSDDRCEPFDKELQVDITHCSSGEDAPSNNLGWIAAFDYGRFTYTPPDDCKPNECEPKEWEVVSRSEKQYGEWGECPSVSTRETCSECREWTQEVVESNGCDTRTMILDGVESREVDCPPPPPCDSCECNPELCPPPPPLLQCFYEINCRNQTFTFLKNNPSQCPAEQKQKLCEDEGGTWGIFIGEASSQCATPLPGVYKEDWRLTPGQSHKDCLKFTGHD